MNLRCSFCQTPYTIGRIEKLDALQHMDANNLNHYDAHCPKCRRATAIVRKRLEMTMPNWREALKELEAEMKANPQQEAPLPKPESAPAPEAESKPAPASSPKGEPAKKVAQKKKTATKAKTTTKKPAAKKTTAKKKK
ncbi:MAG TPA: hypothetical protein VLA72_11175 [Anaerolineales bacterium]|jgi:hypothetical protein|nr:hypothetical protein [Anaerolineales bacterium]